MKYLSTRNNQIRETFTNVLFTGLSKDGGLYLPTNWPSLKIDDLRDYCKKNTSTLSGK